MRVVKISSASYGPNSIGSNFYLVGKGTSRVLIDAGTGEASSIATLANMISKESIRINAVLFTHSHKSHTQGLLSMPFIDSKTKLMKIAVPHHELKGFTLLKDGDSITETSDATIRVIYTPGHTPDHSCYFLVEENAVFTGDALSGQPWTFPLAENHATFTSLDDYERSLNRILTLSPKTLYPGHGEIINNAKEAIQAALSCQTLIASRICQLLSGKPMSTRRIIQSFQLPRMEGIVEEHVNRLEKLKIIKRVPKAPSIPKDASKIRGPGGLTMVQIYAKVQESMKRDGNEEFDWKLI